VRAMVTVFDGRVIDTSFSTDTRAEFFNKIDPWQTLESQRSLKKLADINEKIFSRADFKLGNYLHSWTRNEQHCFYIPPVCPDSQRNQNPSFRP
ncbi:MAG: hypothetical protein WCC39_00960, partial [Telluria sp.]